MTAIDQTAETADVAELYARLARRLEHIVRLDVRAPDAIIEEVGSDPLPFTALPFAVRAPFLKIGTARVNQTGWL